MQQPIAARSRLIAIGFLLTICACAPINHEREVRQAQDRMQEASGVRPQWGVLTVLRPLEVPEDCVLTLDAAVDLALINNRALRADLEVIGQAKADLVQAGLLSNPVLSFMLRFPDGGGRPDLGFGLTQDLAELWLIPSREQAAQSVLQQKILSFTDSAVALVRDVKTTYITLQYQQRASQYQRETLQIVGHSIEIAQARLLAGSSAQLDINLLEARRLELELDLLLIESEQRTTQRTLLRLMGVADASTAWAAAPLVSPSPVPEVDEGFLTAWGLLSRLDVQAAGWEFEAALADFEQERLRFIQSLGIGISAERFEQRSQPGRKILNDTARTSVANGQLTAPEIEPRSARRAERRQEIDWVLGPSFEIPLPIFDQNQARAARAQFVARERWERYDELEQRAIESIRTALATHRIATARVKLFAESLVPVQQSNLQLAESAYQSGKEGILTVLVAQEALVKAQLGHLTAIRDQAISAATLSRELGGRLPRADELDVLHAAASQPAEVPSSGKSMRDGDQP